MISQIILVNFENKNIQINSINASTCVIMQTPSSYYFHKLSKIKLKKYFVNTFVSFYLRLVWRGKAYRVRFFKKKKKFTFNFGHSHWYKIIYSVKKFQFYRLRRQSYLVTYYNRCTYFFLRDLFNNIRPYNKYNKRGIRLKKTFYKQRFGKISQVNSILHSF